MESYVVRIYRRAADDPACVIGIIETVQSGRQQRFSCMQELWEILAARDIRTRDQKGAGAQTKGLREC